MPIILGTGASEAIPSPFCDCDVCNNAREKGGKERRTRCDFMIDEKNFIDYCPDIVTQANDLGLHMAKLENIFLTHFHDDHLDITDLCIMRSRNPGVEFTVNIYGSKAALNITRDITALYRPHPVSDKPNPYFRHLNFVELEPYVEIETGGIKVTPIMSSHVGYGENEMGYNYIVNKNGKTFLYATDTGWYDQNTWDYFSENDVKFDYIVIENTYGKRELPDYQRGHLDNKNLLMMLQKMSELGKISKETPVYLTHMCHIAGTHEELERYFSETKWNIIVGYDYLRIEE